MRKKRMKIGRRLVTPPGVKSMTDGDGDAPTPRPGDGKPDKPADELSEELARMVKAAYQ
jgi:hypothetical protein